MYAVYGEEMHSELQALQHDDVGPPLVKRHNRKQLNGEPVLNVLSSEALVLTFSFCRRHHRMISVTPPAFNNIGNQ